MMQVAPAAPLSARQLNILHALGVPVYRRFSQVAAIAPPAPLALPAIASELAPDLARTTPERAPVRPTPARVSTRESSARTRSLAAEFVMPSAELRWFGESKLQQHLARALGFTELIAAENTELADTALYLDLPGSKMLKLGGIARLRSQWRARRDAWQAIRLWRKFGRGEPAIDA
jgi:hypothetical protein